ncbi:MAG: hypothetical protein F6K41_17320 [Symploca sp. SIO3E6]|nr:hypothetical protein [Caldora sp. SIO3E6]
MLRLTRRCGDRETRGRGDAGTRREEFSCMVVKKFFHGDCLRVPLLGGVRGGFCLLPPAFCLLPSAFCLLPSAFCLLPSASLH